MRQFGKLDLGLKLLFGLLMSGLIVWSFLVPDDPDFQYPGAARILFWHIPCPTMLSAFMILGCYFSLRYFVKLRPLFARKTHVKSEIVGPYPRLAKTSLKPFFAPETDVKQKEIWDMRATSALEIGMIFGCLTMLSGMLFSLVSWGAIWQSDPRQTSFLLALLIYAAYFAVRTAFKDSDKRATNAAAYMMAAVLPLLFLVYIFPRLPQIEAASFHPTNTIIEGKLTGQYGYVTFALIIMVSILATWVYRIRVRIGILLLEKQHGTLEVGSGRSRPSVMVRPVRLPHEDRPIDQKAL